MSQNITLAKYEDHYMRNGNLRQQNEHNNGENVSARTL